MDIYFFYLLRTAPSFFCEIVVSYLQPGDFGRNCQIPYLSPKQRDGHLITARSESWIIWAGDRKKTPISIPVVEGLVCLINAMISTCTT